MKSSGILKKESQGIPRNPQNPENPQKLFPDILGNLVQNSKFKKVSDPSFFHEDLIFIPLPIVHTAFKWKSRAIGIKMPLSWFADHSKSNVCRFKTSSNINQIETILFESFSRDWAKSLKGRIEPWTPIAIGVHD